MTNKNLRSTAGPDGPEIISASAKAEATRCLFCFDAPCETDCPAGIDVPGFIRRIMQDNVRGAYQLIRRENPLSWICGALCPTERLCASRCPRKSKDTAIDIAGLQTLASREHRPTLSSKEGKGSGNGRAAIVGAGPAGLTAAWYLLDRGFKVDLYEAEEYPGGLVTYGIRPDKVNKERALNEMEGLLHHPGITTHMKVRISDPRDLLKGHSLVYVATGLGPEKVDDAAAHLKNIYPATGFLKEVNKASLKGRTFRRDFGKGVLVIGGGNTAMDSAIAARLSGASDVTIVYRRTEEEMPAWGRERETARRHGANFRFLLEPVSFRGKDGRIDRVVFRPTRLGRRGRDGRRELIPAGGSNVSIAAGTVIWATGRKKEMPVWAGSETIDTAHGRLGKSRIWIGGELRRGAGLVVEAVADGKRIAREIVGVFGEGRLE